MNSNTNENFWQLYRKLPENVRKQAREAYRLFANNPSHPGLQFKKVHPVKPVYSARISQDYRVLGILHEDTIIWFWIGSHTEYERMISRF